MILGGLLTGTKSYGAETLTVAIVDHGNDNGNPREQLTRYNTDKSWEREINDFATSILEGEAIVSGTSLDAFKTMKLVNQIYYSDQNWRTQFKISNPNKI